jgi:hypothetical protein
MLRSPVHGNNPDPDQPLMRLSLLFAAPLAAIGLARSAAAQGAAPARPAAAVASPVPSQALMLENIERSRQNVLKYVDAAPDSVLAYRLMPGVRTFGEQIEHAAGATTFIIAAAWKVKIPPPAMADSAARRRQKPALRAFVNERYGSFAAAVRQASASQLATPATYAGTTAAGWRWVDTALEHATWTLGQTVPYLRANGVTPPQYLPF